MSHILAINAGSSSFKCALYELKENTWQLVEAHNKKTIQELLAALPNVPLLGIGHRVVHGGARYSKATLIDAAVITELKSLIELAPLHNGPAVEVIEATLAHYGTSISQVAVFDTAFYAAMPKLARYYAIPKELSDTHEIFRYGFHGISHSFLWKKFVEHSNKPSAKIITLHLGAGCSATAINSGTPIDTSMGFTPNEGLVMATRCGNIDPQVVSYLAEKENRSTNEVLELLNYKSGLLGLSGISSDMKELLLLYASDTHAQFAIDLFCYRAVSYIGSYLAALAGVDAIIFSGGIGENAAEIRSMIIKKMGWYGIVLDDQANTHAAGGISKISHEESSVEVYVIATDEAQQIAHEVNKIMQ